MNGMKIEKAIKILEPYKKSVFGDASEKYGGSISVEEIIELLKELEHQKRCPCQECHNCMCDEYRIWAGLPEPT